MYKIRDSLAEENIKREREDRNFYLFAGILMAIFAVMIALNAFVYYFVAVQGASMQPTLFTGDFLIVNRLKGFGYGDIIIIDGEKENDDPLIKRVIGLAGDTVKIEGGYVYLKKQGESDFKKLDEPYLYSEGITFYPVIDNPSDTEETVFSIGENQVFYLGDNRMNSRDSRSAFGTCDTEQVSGVVANWSLGLRPVLNFISKIFKKGG